MNSTLFDRELGKLGPKDFSKQVTTKLLRTFRPAPQHRFDGGHKGAITSGNGIGNSGSAPKVDHNDKLDLWAHQAGVQALALERFDGRM